MRLPRKMMGCRWMEMMMSKVTELRKEPEAPKQGETTWLMCPCTEEGTPFIVATYVSDEPFVAFLVCPECEQEVPVLNGYIGRAE